MLFNQISFWIAFCLFLILYYMVPSKKQKYVLLLGNISYAFYQNVISGIVLIMVIFVSYFGAIEISHNIDEKKAKRIEISSITIIVVCLFIFKYLRFVAESIESISGISVMRDILDERISNIIVPLGISFYSLRAIAYLVNVYKGEKVIDKWSDYCAMLSFFPLLPSGPVERETSLITEIRKEKAFDFDDICKGLQVFGAGLFMKMVLADRIAVLVNNVYEDYTHFSGSICLAIMIMYSIQIYCDFCGYSYMAIGISKMMGITICENFRRPYLATNIKDFWRRWHISFSSWLREYIYIPLGGNKKGNIRKNINVLITFLVSGLWHGASWNFVIWGGLHGIFQIAGDISNSLLKIKSDSSFIRVIKIVFTFIIVSVAWVYFRMDNATDATLFLKHIYSDFSFRTVLNGGLFEVGLGRMQVCGIGLAAIVVAVAEIMCEKGHISFLRFNEKSIFFRWGIYYIAMTWMIVVYIQLYGICQKATFIYTNF